MFPTLSSRWRWLLFSILAVGAPVALFQNEPGSFRSARERPSGRRDNPPPELELVRLLKKDWLSVKESETVRVPFRLTNRSPQDLTLSPTDHPRLPCRLEGIPAVIGPGEAVEFALVITPKEYGFRTYSAAIRTSSIVNQFLSVSFEVDLAPD